MMKKKKEEEELKKKKYLPVMSTTWQSDEKSLVQKPNPWEGDEIEEYIVDDAIQSISFKKTQ